MANVRNREHLMPASSFSEPPTVGTFYASRSGGSALLVNSVRSVIGLALPSYRIVVTRVRLNALPDGVQPKPWPTPPGHQGRGRRPTVARAANGPPRPITPLSATRAAERKRVVALNRAHRDPERQNVEQVRISSGNVVQAEWRDPDDVNPNRRVARTIRGYRARDAIEVLEENGSITPSQARAAKRFRKLYELGEIGLKPSPNLLEATGGGFAPGIGPSEARLRWLEAYQRVSAALRPRLLNVAVALLIREQTLKAYAAFQGIGRAEASGLLSGCLSFLVDYFKEEDDTAKSEHEAAPPVRSD